MSDTYFLVDGFNLHHSLVELGDEHRGRSTKWLDLSSMCCNYLSAVGDRVGDRAEMGGIYYFSARPTHKKADVQRRHALYMRCLRHEGVVVELSQFKRKDRFCRECDSHFIQHEEKETDVAIATKLFEVCYEKSAGAIVLVTGDTDLAPAVRTCKELFPQTLIMFLFPYNRRNAELDDLCPHSISLKPGAILSHQFDDPLVLPDGSKVEKPSRW